MRKNISLSVILIALVSSISSMVPRSQSADSNTNTISACSFLGYERQAKVGSGEDCRQLRLVYVIGSSEEIDTGTYVWGNPQCTAAYPDGIITSLSGSTYGLSFYIVDGLVGEQAEPC